MIAFCHVKAQYKTARLQTFYTFWKKKKKTSRIVTEKILAIQCIVRLFWGNALGIIGFSTCVSNLYTIMLLWRCHPIFICML